MPNAHPKPIIVSKARLCALFQVSTQAVDNWVRHGCPRVEAGERAKEAKFDLGAVLPWYKAWKDGSTHRRDLDSARADLTRSHEERSELELRRLRRELVEVTVVEAVWSRLVSNFRSRILGMASKLAGSLVGIGEPNVIRDRIEAETTQALAELSDEGSLRLVADPPRRANGRKNSAATAAPDRKPVGGREPAALV